MSPAGQRRMVADLVRGDLSALTSDRNAWALVSGVALVLAVITMMAAQAGFALYFTLAYAILPLFTTAVAAVLVSGDRSKGYAAVLHTAPVTPTAYYVAKLATACLWALLAVGITLPYTALLAWYGGDSFLDVLAPWFAVAVAMAMYGAGLGTLVSAAVGRRGLMSSAFAGLGAAFGLALVPVLLTFATQAQAESSRALAHLSPVFAVLSAVTGPAPDLADWPVQRAVLLVLFFAAVFAGTGYVLYVRYQNPEGWDAATGRAAPVAALALVLLAAPLAALDFDKDPPEAASDGVARSFGDRSTGPTVLRAVAPLDRVGASGSPTLERDQPSALPISLMLQDPQGRDFSQATVRIRADFSQVRGDVRPAEFLIADWSPVPCAGAAGERQGCWTYPVQEVTPTVTVQRISALREQPIMLFIEVVAPGGEAHGFLSLTVDGGAGWVWWSPLVVWVGVVLAFAAPQELRSRRLGRMTTFHRVAAGTRGTPGEAPGAPAGREGR